MSKRRPKRMKRSYLKRFSSHTVNGGGGRFTPWIMGMVHGNPRTIGEQHYLFRRGQFIDPQPPTSDPKLEIERTLEYWKSDFYQGFNRFCFIVVHGRHYQSLKRFFSGERIFFILETKEEIKRSITYPTKQLAMLAFTKGRITWVEIEPKPPPVASD